MNEIHSIVVVLTFNGLDLLTGFITAVKNKNIQSGKLRDGLFKKVGFILCYFVAWLVDKYGATIGFKFAVDILPIVIFYVCTTELVSILENICKINENILPKKLMEIFQITDLKEMNKDG